MAIIHEETKHEYLPVSLMVSQRQKGETIAPWAILHCEVDGTERMTPKELVELGQWLVQQGLRIGHEYKLNGAPRATLSSPASTEGALQGSGHAPATDGVKVVSHAQQSTCAASQNGSEVGGNDGR